MRSRCSLTRWRRLHLPRVRRCVFSETWTTIEPVAKAIRVLEQLTERTAAAYRSDMARLGALPPDVEPRATQHVAGMIAMTKALIDKGHAYVAANGGKVPFAPNGVGFLNLCKVNNQYCYNQMKASCNCMSTCDQVGAAQGMVAAN